MDQTNSNIFEKSLTVAQFKAQCGTKKIYFNPMVEKGTKAKIFYKDSEGNLTTVQRVVATDDANNIIANVSRSVAECFHAGKPLPESIAVGLRHYESVDNDGVISQREGYTIYSPSNLNRTEML